MRHNYSNWSSFKLRQYKITWLRLFYSHRYAYISTSSQSSHDLKVLLNTNLRKRYILRYTFLIVFSYSYSRVIWSSQFFFQLFLDHDQCKLFGKNESFAVLTFVLKGDIMSCNHLRANWVSRAAGGLFHPWSFYAIETLIRDR